MRFGKKGRPPKDRLARQRNIFERVAPLILQKGARQISMEQVADLANLSIGGLYHYFPTKRDLVLHGLRPEAILRLCQDFHDEFDYLTENDPKLYIEQGIELAVGQIQFCRPALHAALELGADSFWEVIERLLNGMEQAFEGNLQRVFPEASESEVQRWGRAIRRAICAALLDKTISSDELREELRILVNGYTPVKGS